MVQMRIWCLVGAYVPPNDVPTVACMNQALGKTAKEVKVVLMGDLNVRLGEPPDAQEETLVMVVADYRLEEMTYHFMPRSRYRGDGSCTWWMRR